MSHTEHQLTSKSCEWGTSGEVVEKFRAILGTFFVDPFSSAKWNAQVKALRYGSLEPHGWNGFEHPWFHDAPPPAEVCDPSRGFDVMMPFTAIVNPPGNRSGSNVKRAWRILTGYRARRWLDGGAAWIGFSLSQLQTLQGEGPTSPFDPGLLRCIPSSRVPYETEPGVPVDQPTQSSWFALLPAPGAHGERQREMFRALFSPMGAVF